MIFKNRNYGILISLLASIICIFLAVNMIKDILTPETLNVELINEKLETNEYTELYYVGRFESGKGVICVAKSELPYMLYDTFKQSFPDGPLESAEALHLIYFIESRNKYSYRSQQVIPIQKLTSTPSNPFKLKSNASYGNQSLYYIAYLGDKYKNIEIDNKTLSFHSFNVEISGEIEIVSLAYYISDK